MNWSYLPSEISFAVLRQIDLRSLLRCSSVCKNWRFNVLDDHLWENLYHIDYQFDNTVPYDNQAWRTFYIRKSKVFKAIQSRNVYIKTIIANHEAHMENKFIGPGVSMYKDSVITTWASQAVGSLNLKVLGCHAKNIYTEEVSKQLGKSWYSKAIGDHLLSFNVDGLSFGPEWHTLNATKITPNISDMKFSSERNTPWDDRPYKVAIFNAEPTCTQLICVDQRFGNAVIYDWSTKEKKELSELIVGTPIAFHKSTIVTKTRDVVRVYMNDELLHQSSVENEIQFAQLNDTLLVCATVHYVWIFDRRNNYEHFKFKHERSFPLFLFDDLLVYQHVHGLVFYNVNARKILGTVFYRGKDMQHVIRHSPNEFLVQSNDAIMLLNFETKSSNISVMHVADNDELKEITIKSSKLLDFAVDALKTTAGNVESCYVMKKPGGRRYIMLFSGKPNKRAKTNVKANELIREYFRVTSGYVYMPFCPYTTDPANIYLFDLHKRVTLDRDVVITGDVIIYCEQIVNEKTERVKPDKWPTELYTKTVVEEKNTTNNNQNSDNKKSKKKK